VATEVSASIPTSERIIAKLNDTMTRPNGVHLQACSGTGSVAVMYDRMTRPNVAKYQDSGTKLACFLDATKCNF
jgi:hypothetical protein